ncbi:unnamed protein product [Rhizoctonia solani]|uniref:Uncharacterized protein n=1 Tax=Rhizoctonia solani TaxID=456999 RepID=A0A8H3A2T1_9AGAM|nr:unnamed protein product [Rhizoctonia solani]
MHLSPQSRQRKAPMEKINRISQQLVMCGFKLVQIEDKHVESGSDTVRSCGTVPWKTSTVGNTIYGSVEVSFPDFPPLPVVWCPKPHNFTPGKGPNSQVGIMDYTEHALTVTPGINMMLTIRHQKLQKIIHDLILMIANNCKEWVVFEPEDYWPLRGYVYLALKYYKDQQLRNLARASLTRLKASSAEDGGNSWERAQNAARERGKASARARALKTTAHTLVDSADNQHSIIKYNNTNNNGQYNSKQDINNACDDHGADQAQARTLDPARNSNAAVEDMVHDISSMSICVPNDDNLPISDDEPEGAVLPPSLLAPPSMEEPVASPLLASPDTPTSSALELGTAEIQAALFRISHLSPVERAKLPPHIQLLLAALNPSSIASAPVLLSKPGPIRPSVANSAPLATTTTIPANPPTIAPPPAPPAYNLVSATTPTGSLALRLKGRPRPQARTPPTHSTSQSGSASRPIPNSTAFALANVPPPVAIALVSGTGEPPAPRLSSSFKTIDQIELGPTALEVDADDYLSDLSSASELNQPVETNLRNEAMSRRVEGCSQAGGSKAMATGGVSQGAKESVSSKPVQMRATGRDTERELGTTLETMTNAKGKGKARGHTEYTSESTIDSTRVSSRFQRVTRSRKNA